MILALWCLSRRCLPFLRYIPNWVMKSKTTLSNPTLLALVHRWMMSASIFTPLVVQVSPRVFRRHFASLFTGHPSVRPPEDFLIQLMIFFHSCHNRHPRPTPSRNSSDSAASLLSYVWFHNPSCSTIVWLDDFSVVPSNCHNERIPANATYSPKCH